MVIGEQAVLRYGEPRLTKDIDVALGLSSEGLKTIREVEDTGAFVRKTLVLPGMNEDTVIRIDFMFSLSECEKQAIERAVSVTMKGAPVNFASLEDVVIHKNPDYDPGYIDG